MIKTESKSTGNTTPKDIRPGSPISTVSTTPNSTASSHHSNNGDLKPLNGTYSYTHITNHFKITSVHRIQLHIFIVFVLFFCLHSLSFGLCCFIRCSHSLSNVMGFVFTNTHTQRTKWNQRIRKEKLRFRIVTTASICGSLIHFPDSCFGPFAASISFCKNIFHKQVSALTLYEQHEIAQNEICFWPFLYMSCMIPSASV